MRVAATGISLVVLGGAVLLFLRLGGGGGGGCGGGCMVILFYILDTKYFFSLSFFLENDKIWFSLRFPIFWITGMFLKICKNE